MGCTFHPFEFIVPNIILFLLNQFQIIDSIVFNQHELFVLEVQLVLPVLESVIDCLENVAHRGQFDLVFLLEVVDLQYFLHLLLVHPGIGLKRLSDLDAGFQLYVLELWLLLSKQPIL